ncbi:MAG: SAM-dependent methyltransferase [Xanthomarina sp.]|uniref:BREX-1 system adenine-specific DNA-methyltransferase PglX n=1 Tax=Xanthomarina sp. TaxID=1931211 RepID=UPI000C46C661|nr:BREX-1 system adenine-specific DNA-methyltransferase PglX [Xanthomarina sp.]MAL23060.1 SAM-dependent methyltransferase [Xanthomarina sp.]MBF61759.1 SAM-dependent methyltransferase [Xanthomarina sp.]
MNTNNLKRFAQAARLKLLDQIGAKLEKVLTTDSAELREKANQIKQLQEAINKSNKQQVIDTVAYTWFNRLVALRFMDVNGYEPIGIKVVSPASNATLPELLQEAKAGNIPQELPVNHQRIYQILDGTIPSANAQNEAYRELLVGSCNHLHTVFPFLFERINDYSELLLPDDLISSFSIIEDIKQGMLPEDCQEVEILGWLYQFYISALNEKLISSKKKYAKNELAPASQLFTPKWIVQYMVDNTLGQIWSEIRPDSKVMESLEFYIKPTYTDKLHKREPKSIEDIKFFEPCVGSGHILSYAFDVFYKIYEEEGYNPSEIPTLIITKNLYGVDIDQRAAQIASFVLLMKGRQKQRRFLRTVAKEHIEPNISYYQDFEFDNKFKNATALGSLIRVDPKEVADFKIENNSLFAERQKEVFKLYKLLGQRYDCVVTNPPYISSSRMEGSLKQFVEANYPETKYDLFATFILRCLELCDGDGLTGYMTPFVWMFIESYEKIRKIILKRHQINNLVQLEYSGFDGATVPICTFTIKNKPDNYLNGNYIKLSKFRGSKQQGPKTLEAIRNRDCGWFYSFKQSDFNKIPSTSLGYWLTNKIIDSFTKEKIEEKFIAKAGIVSGNDAALLKLWYEIKFKNISFNEEKYKRDSLVRWVPINKGGSYRKYYGNNEYIINIWDLWTEGKTTKSVRRGSKDYYFKEGVTWTMVTSSRASFRYTISKVFNVAAPSIFSDHQQDIFYVLGFLNSKVVEIILPALNPTLNILTGDILSLPNLITQFKDEINIKVKSQINISKFDWDSRETAWNFQQNELIRIKGQDTSTSLGTGLEEAYDSYCHYWQNKFMELHKNEEALNKQFIDIYGLQDELKPDVPLEDITILKEETSIVNNQLVFNAKEVLQQFVSYAVGCMFGRYSLDQPGLILANQGETLEDYLNKLATSNQQLATSFMPDDDNIIPILDNEWFEDDIVGRFYEFLKVTFGKANFEKNLAFVEECLGKDIRKYFLKDFYNDHWKRYKKRPIYWMFSSPSGAFNVLIYMHRYTPDTLNQILNGYLKDYREKLTAELDRQAHIKNVGTAREQTLAAKEEDRIHKVLLELQEYERELYKMATDRISIDLDDGVLVNYNKFGNLIKEVSGLNDKKTKDKVRKFDWIDVTEIR